MKIKTGKGIIPTWATIQTVSRVVRSIRQCRLAWQETISSIPLPSTCLKSTIEPFSFYNETTRTTTLLFVDTNFANVKVFLKKIFTVRNKHFPNNKSLRIIYISGSNNELRPDELKVKNDKDPHKLFAVLIFSNILWFKISHETTTIQVLCWSLINQVENCC